jgi:hypothetical protein
MMGRTRTRSVREICHQLRTAPMEKVSRTPKLPYNYYEKLNLKSSTCDPQCVKKHALLNADMMLSYFLQKTMSHLWSKFRLVLESFMR